MLGRAEPEGPAQEVEQQRVLRAATELRGRLAAAKERCDAMALDLQALLLRRQRREAASAADGQRSGSRQRNSRPQNGGRQDGEQADAVEVAIHELFGDSDSDVEPTNGNRRTDQRPQNTATGPAGGRQQHGRAQAAQRQRPRQGRPADDNFESPYLRIVDPTVVQRRPGPQLSDPQQQQQQQQRTAAAAGVQRQRSSSLPEEVRRKLAAQVRWGCSRGLAVRRGSSWLISAALQVYCRCVGTSCAPFRLPTLLACCRRLCCPPVRTLCSGIPSQVGQGGLVTTIVATSAPGAGTVPWRCVSSQHI